MRNPGATGIRALLAGFAVCLGAVALPAMASASIQLGAYTPGAPASASALSEYQRLVGRPPDIVMWFREFGEPLMYPNEAANLRATGQEPMVTWEPQEQPLAAIAAGSYDGYLREQAEAAKSWGAPLMIRFAHEMNGDWFSWGSPGTSPETFVSAWRHVVDLFRSVGAYNVEWVWAPNVQEGGRYP
ncbi:MAG: glycosyl hydrolase, partial [Syntrophothermus sp.]